VKASVEPDAFRLATTILSDGRTRTGLMGLPRSEAKTTIPLNIKSFVHPALPATTGRAGNAGIAAVGWKSITLNRGDRIPNCDTQSVTVSRFAVIVTSLVIATSRAQQPSGHACFLICRQISPQSDLPSQPAIRRLFKAEFAVLRSDSV